MDAYRDILRKIPDCDELVEISELILEYANDRFEAGYKLGHEHAAAIAEIKSWEPSKCE